MNTKLGLGIVLGIGFFSLAVAATDLTGNQKLYIKSAVPNNVLAEEISDRLDAMDLVGETATFTVEDEVFGINTIKTTIQFKDEAGDALTVPLYTLCWVSDATTGLDLADTAGTSAIVTTSYGTLLKEETTGLVGHFLTDASGRLGIKLTQTAAVGSQYWACKTGVNKIVVSSDDIDFN